MFRKNDMKNVGSCQNTVTVDSIQKGPSKNSDFPAVNQGFTSQSPIKNTHKTEHSFFRFSHPLTKKNGFSRIPLGPSSVHWENFINGSSLAPHLQVVQVVIRFHKNFSPWKSPHDFPNKKTPPAFLESWLTIRHDFRLGMRTFLKLFVDLPRFGRCGGHWLWCNPPMAGNQTIYTTWKGSMAHRHSQLPWMSWFIIFQIGTELGSGEASHRSIRQSVLETMWIIKFFPPKKKSMKYLAHFTFPKRMEKKIWPKIASTTLPFLKGSIPGLGSVVIGSPPLISSMKFAHLRWENDPILRGQHQQLRHGHYTTEPSFLGAHPPRRVPYRSEPLDCPATLASRCGVAMRCFSKTWRCSAVKRAWPAGERPGGGFRL